MVSFRVEAGDSILSIAQKEYGNPDYWTTLWNDNDTIKNPNLIEKGSSLMIRKNKPGEPEDLKDSLKERLGAKKIASATPVDTKKAEENKAEAKEVSPTPTPQNASVSPSGPLNEAQINFLGNCESGMNPATNTGNGFYGAFQFTIGTWNRMGTGYERADLAPLDVQVQAVQKLVSGSSIFGQFPACSSRMRALGIL
jgi:hypothetical protein